MTTTRRRAGAAAAAATLLYLAWVGFGWGGTDVTTAFDDVAETLAALVAAASCAATALASEGRARRSWWGLASGSAAWGLGQAVWSWYEIGSGIIPFPSAADAGYLLFPVGAGAGLWWMSGASLQRSRVRLLVDGATVAGALFMVSWASALGAAWHTSGAGALGFAISLAYPVADIVLLTMVAVLVSDEFGPRRRLVPELIGAGLSVLAVSDSTFAYLTGLGKPMGAMYDVGWVASFLLIGLAAVAGRTEEPVPAPADRRPSNVVPYGAFLVAVTTVVVQAALTHSLPVPESVAAALVVLAVFGRQLLVLSENRVLVQTLAAREAELRFQALHDPLTGLPNRVLFLDRLSHALTSDRRSPRPLAVLFLDLDDFKEINDSLGHPAGDDLLRQVAVRLAALLRDGDTVARLSGDEFAALLESDVLDPMAPARRLLDAFREPFTIEGRPLPIGASIGVVPIPLHGRPNAIELMRDVDIAMYAAKRAGKNGVQIFDPALERHGSRELELRVELSEALAAGELTVAYQPIVCATTGRLTSLETLARWHHPVFGTVPPDEFVPIAERANLVPRLTDLVLDRACADLRRWLDAYDFPLLRISVNVSASELGDPTLPVRIAAALAAHRLDGSRLTIEITETAFAANDQIASAALEEIKALGIGVAVDDFGTGFSSLARLRQLNFQGIKIDRFFLRDIADNAQARDLAESMFALGRSMGLLTVAEGVETEEQRELLRGMAVDRLQGYLISRPVPAGDVVAFLEASPRTPEEAAARIAGRGVGPQPDTVDA